MRLLILLLSFYSFLFSESFVSPNHQLYADIYQGNLLLDLSGPRFDSCYYRTSVTYNYSSYFYVVYDYVGSTPIDDFTAYCNLTYTYVCEGNFIGDMDITTVQNSNNCQPCPIGTEYISDTQQCEPICPSDHIYDSTLGSCVCPAGQIEDLSGNCVAQTCSDLITQKQSECDSLGKLLNGYCDSKDGQIINNTLECINPPIANCTEIQTAFFDFPPDCGGGTPEISCIDNGTGDPTVEFYCKVAPNTSVGGTTSLSTQIDNLNQEINNNFTDLNTKIDNLPDHTQKLNDIESKIDNIKDPTNQLNDIQSELNSIDSSLSSQISNLDTKVSNLPDNTQQLNDIQNNQTDIKTNQSSIKSNQVGISSQIVDLSSKVDNINLDTSSINTNINNMETNINSKLDNLNIPNYDIEIGNIQNDLSNIDMSISDLDSKITNDTSSINTNISNLETTISSDLVTLGNTIKGDIDFLDSENSNIVKTLRGLETGVSDLKIEHCTTSQGSLGVMVNGNCVSYANVDEGIVTCPQGGPVHPINGCDRTCADVGWFDAGNGNCIKQNDCNQVKRNCASFCADFGNIMNIDTFSCFSSTSNCDCISPTPEPSPSPTPDITCKTYAGLAGYIINGECVPISPTPIPASDTYCITGDGLTGVKINGQCIAISPTPNPTPTSTPDIYCKTLTGLSGIKVNGECIAISAPITIPTIDVTLPSDLTANVTVNMPSDLATGSDLDLLATNINSKLDEVIESSTSDDYCACPPTCEKFFDGIEWKCSCNGIFKECHESNSFTDEDLNNMGNIEDDTEGIDTLKSYASSDEFKGYINKYKIKDLSSCPSWDENEVSFEIDITVPIIGYHIQENKAFAPAKFMDSIPYHWFVSLLYFLVGSKLFYGVIRG